MKPRWEAHEFDDHFMIKQPGGGSFPVAKKGLGKNVLDRIKSYVPNKMADGGIVPGIDDVASSMPDTQKMKDPTLDIPELSPQEAAIQSNKDYLQKLNPGIYSSAPDMLDRDAQNMLLSRAQKDYNIKMSDQESAASRLQKLADQDRDYNEKAAKLGLPLRKISSGPSQPQMTPAVASADGTMMPERSSPYTTQQSPYDNYFSTAQNGLNSLAGATKSFGSEADKIYSDMTSKIKTIDDHMQDFTNEFKAKDQKLSDAILTGKEDPNRYWNNMSTGNKISSAIALMFSGAGSGLTGRSNAALDVINKAIDNDIQSQRNDINNKKTLLSENLSKYKTEIDASRATKVDLLTSAQAQLAKAAMKVSSQQALSTLQNQASQIQMQKDVITRQLAQSQGLQRALQGGASPEIAAQAVQLMPEKLREQAYKEIDRVTAAQKAGDAINSFFGSANDQNSVLTRIIRHGGFEPADLKALEANVMPVIKDLEGRVNEREMEVLKGLYPAQGDSPSTIQTKLRGLNNFISNKRFSSLLEGNGIRITGGRFDNSGKSRFSEGAPQ